MAPATQTSDDDGPTSLSVGTSAVSVTSDTVDPGEDGQYSSENGIGFSVERKFELRSGDEENNLLHDVVEV
jgi:hypothetical protein